MKLCFRGDIQDCLKGLEILSDDYDFELDDEGLKIEVEQSPGCDIVVWKAGNRAKIRYSEKIHFFRAVGLLLEALPKKENFEIVETPQFTMNGAMFDVSQSNAVMRVGTIKDILKRMAVMGLNMFMLYTEDSYVVEEEPYLGYMRSKYTYEELKECDDFAYALGIEMIPCIQTLAHLADVLKWSVYVDMRDDEETLLVGDDRVYEFIEHLITSASAPFRSKRIHIGMDEAWRLGLGVYLQKNGLRRKFDIMNEHLERVLKIVEEKGLEPMIWSDMYFRAASKTGEYYDLDAAIPRDVIDAVPDGIQLVYWDYYHDDQNFYEEFIKKHKGFNSKPIFAGGIWTWIGFAANWGKTFNTTNPALDACKAQGVDEVFVTIWGDNGTESNIYSNLLGLQLFAEHGYSRELDMGKLRRRFEFCTGCKYDDFMDIKYLDEIPGSEIDNMNTYNPSKYLMWQDLLAGLFDKNIEGLPLNNHYRDLTQKFDNASKRNGHYNFLFEYLGKVSYVLALKSQMGIEITNAYKNDDRDMLEEIRNKRLPDLLERVQDLRVCHKKQWTVINKRLGWEIMDMRYGSLIIRIETAKETIDEYLSGTIDIIEELEEERLSFDGKPGLVSYVNFYDQIVSASRIAAHG